MTPISLLVLTFALGVGTALNNPAWQAIQPDLVPREEFPQAVTLGGASINLGRAIGPALGGLLVAAAGPWFVFGLNALSFGAVIAVLAWWRRDPDASDGPPERFVGAVRAGTRYALHSHALAGVLVRAGVFSAASAGLLALLPVYSTAVLGLGSGGFGLLLAGFGVGAIVAAGFLPALRARMSEDAVVATGTLGVAAALLGLALNDTTAVAIVLVVLAGAAWLLCLSTLNVRVAAGGARVGPRAWPRVLPQRVHGRHSHRKRRMGCRRRLHRLATRLRLGRARRRAHPIARPAVEPQLGQRCRPVPRSHARTRNAVRARGRDWTGTRHAHV